MPSVEPSIPTAAVRGSAGPVRAACARLPCAAAGAKARPPALPSGVGGAAWASPQVRGRVPHLPAGGRARPGPALRWAPPSPPLRCARPEAAVAPLPHGGPGRAGPLRGRLLAGAGLRRAGAGGAAGRRVRRRVLLRPAHLRGRHRHLPQPRLVGVLVRGQPGGAARGAARRRGAAGAQGPRGHAAAAAGARPQPPPHGRARPRPPRRPGAAARRELRRPPRRARQVRAATGPRRVRR